MSTDPTLAELLEQQYFALAVRIRSEHTRNQYRYAIQDLAEFLGRLPHASDLTDDTITRLIMYLRDSRKLAPRTCNDRRGRLNSLWRWLSNTGRTRTSPTNIGLPVPTKTPRAWSVDDLTKLMRACITSPGTLGGIPASTWWTAFHLIAWDTAARTTEILSLRWEWLDWQTGWIRAPHEVRKGGLRDGSYRLMADTRKVLGSFRRPTGVILETHLHPTRFWQLYKELLARAGLPASRYDGPQKMRRSHASWLAANEGDATESLMHLSEATTRRYYLDPTITQRSAPSEQLPFRLFDLVNDSTTQ